DFGDRAVAAVKSYQKDNGGKETGVLNPQERAALSTAAKARQEAVGWRIVDDPATGTRLGLPLKQVPQLGASKLGTHYTSKNGEVQIDTFRIRDPGTTLASVFDQQKKETG